MSITTSGLSKPSQPSGKKTTDSKRPIPTPTSLVPLPPHRHATPSAPWPWIDIEDGKQGHQEYFLPTQFSQKSKKSIWKKTRTLLREVPHRLHVDMGPTAVAVSGKVIHSHFMGTGHLGKWRRIYQLDITDKGHFQLPPANVISCEHTDVEGSKRSIFDVQIDSDIRLRALFLKNLSGPVLKMLGAKYNIEPFFFSSSLNWIPSRYQEQRNDNGDHLTICLTFLRSIPFRVTNHETPIYAQGASPRSSQTFYADEDSRSDGARLNLNLRDARVPLHLTSNHRLLVPDILSIHLIRRKQGSIIISYHAEEFPDNHVTTASYLHQRIRFAGQSVYWQNIFKQYEDSTFVMLLFIWHTLYAWDEALEHLYAHICALEGKTIETRELSLTEELHGIRGHLYYYSSLLNDARKSVEFLQKTRTPIEPHNSDGASTLERECSNLLAEIDRLESGRNMLDQRLKNAMNLVFSSVNITESKQMHDLTVITSRDSAAMKQIAYLSMIFLPSSFIASVFGMNVKEITPGTNGTLVHYVVAALPFTLLTIWIIIAFQSKYIFQDNCTFWMRLGWPYLLIVHAYNKTTKSRVLKKEFLEGDYNV
ncbi:hypothetical protein CPC08DRAFT_723702 [Agrocybe pediades]|nr:hypothetical protein CPC08DRAFT_723702 [Agrocybe pediades]